MDEPFYYSEKNAAEDPDWAFLSSFKLNATLRQPELQAKDEPQTAPLDKYLSLVEFDPVAFKAIKQHSVNAWKGKANRMAQSVRSELAGYYGRVASTYYKILTDAAYAKFQPLPRAEIKEFPEGLRDLTTRPFVFDTLPGTEPSTSWPYSLPELLARLQAMHPAALWLEPFDLTFTFQDKAFQFAKTCEEEQQALEAFKVLFLLSFLSGSGSRLCRALHEFWLYSRSHSLTPTALDSLKVTIQPHVDFLQDLVLRERSLHYVRISSILGRFSVAHHSMFHKSQTGWNTSIASDGEFLYLFVGCQNGGMFKIGTGEQGTISGKVYLFAALERPEDGAWVYCKGKLYLRSSSRETGLISVICPHTFKHEGLLQLYCPELFGSPAQLSFNKNFPFITDKEHLYVVGMKISPAPVPNPPANQKPPEPPPEEEKKEKREESKKKKREEEKKEPKLCEFLLVKFDVGQLQSSNKAFETEPDELTKEIYSSFAGYFTLAECQRALNISQNDIQSAVQWLVENGDNERGKKIVMPLCSTLLCQADVLTMSTGKMMKPEVTVKGDSVLSPEAVARSIWTTDGKEVTVYTVNPDGASATAKIFSTSPEAVKELEPDAHVLPNTPHQAAADSSMLFEGKDLFAPVKVERKEGQQRPYPLKGTHIANRECEKYAILESVCCFDPYARRFYSCLLNWTYGVYFNVFADLPQYGSTLAGLFRRVPETADPVVTFIGAMLELIESYELKKFDLPWKWRCWTTLYRNSIMRHNKLLRATSEEDQSKRIAKIVEKLYQRVERMHKVEYRYILQKLHLTALPEEKKKKKPANEEKKADLFGAKRSSPVFYLKEAGKSKPEAMALATDVPQVTIEDGKDTIMLVEGTPYGLETLLNWALDAKAANSPLFSSLLTHILLWVLHAGNLTSPLPCFSTMLGLLEDILTKERDDSIRDICWKILIHGWRMWCAEPLVQLRWLVAVMQASALLHTPMVLQRKDSFLALVKSEHTSLSFAATFKPGISPLLCWFLRYCSGPQSLLPEAGYFTGFTHVYSILVDKQGNESHLSQAAKVSFEYDESVTVDRKPNFGKLLLTDTKAGEISEEHSEAAEKLWKCLEQALLRTVDEPSSPETPAVFSLFCFLARAAHTYLVDIKDEAVQRNVQSGLVVRIMGVLQRTLEGFYRTEGARTSSLHAKWLLQMKNALLLASHFADKAAAVDQPLPELVQRVIDLIQSVKGLFSTSEGEVLSTLHQNYSVGADSTYERTFETTHPYQRGKQQINENLTFPGALAIYVELDPRSQSDNHVDYLLVSSLETTPGHLNNYSGEVLAPYFKLSGKLSFSGPLVLQGSSLHIEFNASSQPREEASSNRWGFKLKVKPVFGEPQLHLSDSSKTSLYNRLALRFGGEAQVGQWVQLLNGMSFGVSSMVQRLAEKEGMEESSILKWHLFSGGLSCNPYDDCLVVQGGWAELREIGLPQVSAKVNTWKDLLPSLPSDTQTHLQAILTGTSPIVAITERMREVCPAPMNYRAEKLRPSFSKDLQELWRSAESLALYAMLHHTCQLHALTDWVTTNPADRQLTHDERYVKEQLKACGKKVNEVIAWMLGRLQSEREKQQVMLDVWEDRQRRLKAKKAQVLAQHQAELPKEEVKTVPKRFPEELKSSRKLEAKASSKKLKSKRLFMSKVPKKPKKKEAPEVLPLPEPIIELTAEDQTAMRDLFLERFIGNEERTREICLRFGVATADAKEGLKAVFELCYSSSHEEDKSPYWIVANHVLTRLLVLLKFKPNPAFQSAEELEEDMEVPTLTRAVSTATPDSAQKIEAMRNWVDSYKKWKQWQLPSQPEEDLTSPLASPLKAIVKFTCEDFDWSMLEREAMLQTQCAAKRVVGLQLMNRFYEALRDTPAAKMCLNLLPCESVFSGVECCGQIMSSHLNTQAGRIFKELMTMMMTTFASYKDCKSKPPRISSKHAKSQLFVTEGLQNQHLRTLGIIFTNANSLLAHSKLRDYILDSLESLDVTLSQLTEVLLQACSSQQSKLASNVVAACKLLYYSLVEACQGASYLSVLRKRELLSLLITTFLECLEKNTQGDAAEYIQRNEIMLSLLYELLLGAPHKEGDSTLVRLAKTLLVLIETSISPIIMRLSIRIACEIWPILNPSVFPQDVVPSLFQVLGKYVLKADCQPCLSDDKQFSVVLHSNNDEDLGFLLPVLLEWENKYQYLQGRLTEESKEEELVHESEQFLEEWLGEQAFMDFMPEQLRSGDFPVEQYYQYILGQERGGWNRGRGGRRPSARRATGRRPVAKKPSNNTSCATLSKLEKLLEERLKALEEVKAEDEEGEKTRKSNERLFFKRLRQILRDSQTIAGNLSLKGAAAVLEPMPRAKAMELVALIYQIQQQLLVDSKTKLPILPANPYAKQPGEAVSTEVVKAKRLVLCSLVDSQIVQKLEYVLESGSTLSAQRVMDRLSTDITGAYSHPLLSRTVQAGAAFSICINQIIRLIKDLLQAERWSKYIQESVREAIAGVKDWEAMSSERQMQVIGALVTAGGWSDYVRPGSLVAVERSNAQETAIVLQGGSVSGMKNVTLIFPNDPHATPQSLPLKEVKFASRQLDPTDLSVTHDLLAEAVVSMKGSSALKSHLLKACSALNWSEWLSRQDPALSSQFVNQLVAMSADCPIDKTPTAWEEMHALLWEQLIEHQDPNYSLVSMPTKPEAQMDFLSGQEGDAAETGLMAYTLPSSSYISSLPENRSSRRSDISLKMLKYWEKCIIPRIQDFVRSSFKTYEMEYFFEQLRQPLRLGDQAKAIEIAMVLCDNKLPSGVILPDMNHDWSAVTIDECVVGSWVITKLKSKSLAHLESSLLRRYQWQGVSEVPAVIRVVDLRANLVLIEIVDVEQLEITQLWVPVSSLFFPDRTPPLPSNAHQYDSLHKRYSECSQAIRSIYARQTLLQCLSQASISTLTPYISIVDIAKWLVWEELTEDSVEGWLNTRHDYFFPCHYKSPETFSVSNYVHEPQLRTANERSLAWLEAQLAQLQAQERCQERDALLDWTVGAWHELGDQLTSQKRCIDIAELSKLISGPIQSVQITPQSIVTESGNDKKCFPLHFGSNHNCGVIVSFQKAAFLCGNSKLQFFADAAGEELLLELKAGKTGRGTLAPVVFKQGQVWCAYSTFLDATCSVYNQAQEGTTTLACEVCLLPWNWTALTWLTEALTAVIARKPTAEGMQQIHSLNYAVIYVLNTSKAPAPIRQQLFRLLTRVMRRLRYIHCESHSVIPHFEGMGVQDSWLQGLVDEVKTLRDNEFKGSDTLFSSYLQDAVEFLATTMLPWDYFAPAPAPKLAVPEWVEAMIKTMCFLNYFRSEGPLREDIKALLQEALAYNQWQNVYVLRNIAKPIDTLQSTVAAIASANKVRIVDLESDVMVLDEHTAVLITDGLSLAYYQETTFEEEEKKEEQAEEVKEPEVWECPACTLQNPNALNECEACGAPRVVRPVEVPKQADVPHTNVAEVQMKLKANAEAALKEFLSALEAAFSGDEEVKCAVTRMTAEDEDILNKALKQRLLDSEGKLRPPIVSKLEQPGNDFSPLFASAQGTDLKQQFRSAIESSAYATMKRLEEAGIDLWLESALGAGQEQLSLKRLEQLMLAVEYDMCQETRAVLYIPPQFLRFPETSRLSSVSGKSINVADILVTQYPELIGIRLRELRFHWALLKLFNYNLSEAIGLLNLQQHQLLPRGSLTLSTSSAISEIRGLIMLPIKVEMQQRVFEKTALPRENPPKVVLERLKLQKDVKKDSVFLKAFEQMRDFNPALFRIPKPRGADPFIAFQVVFKGELVVGEAGPYRQFFADISRDLQNDRTLGLFCPSVNNKERLGTARDRFVIVPSTTSAQQLQLFEFLGVLMGCCVRTGTRLILDLPSFLWKPLVGQNLRFEDLQSIDYPACEMMKLVESAGLDLFEESFENFCARLSDETIVDLKANGRFIPVTYENKAEFLEKLLQCRFQESQKQCEAMRRGLSRLVPSGMLNLVTWKQLENWVCGKPLVDLELLKRHTRLSGGLEETSPRVQWFWEIVTEFSADERLRFIKFSWGQDRLPGNDEEFERTSTRLMLKPSMMEGNVDGRLPKADTCFFNLELPNYSSKEVMKRQLRFAITADCDSMNADEPVSEQPDNQLRGGEHYSEEEDNME